MVMVVTLGCGFVFDYEYGSGSDGKVITYCYGGSYSG
ncbi:hypothetical protein T01_15001 [Trichinella spiralis]|uniref:Uncharacterized protein n=1 Tax=Trichinella spiralis TaxID=6334 RepID=A0A0V0YSX7_TRISP|nr:hypothetical protein T01_15001 [Trichinella spiralis]